MCDNLSLSKCVQKIMYTHTDVDYIAKVALFSYHTILNF